MNLLLRLRQLNTWIPQSSDMLVRSFNMINVTSAG